MVDQQIQRRGIVDERVLAAMTAVPRHRFVPSALSPRAYDDSPLPIGFDQTISQPYVVAYMTEAAALPRDAVVLEIGTGSGYQAAVLAQIAAKVYSIEIVPELAVRSRTLLDELGYDNIEVKAGDGYRGWPTNGPFDGILVAAAPVGVPEQLFDQLALGGRLIIPIGRAGFQDLRLYTKNNGGIDEEILEQVSFVPLLEGVS